MKRYIIGSFIFGMALVGHAMLTKEQYVVVLVKNGRGEVMTVSCLFATRFTKAWVGMATYVEE